MNRKLNANLNLKKNIIFVLYALIMVCGLFAFPVSASANAPSGIKGNGTDGISIDINASPYTDFANIPTWGQYAYTDVGCAWFASARVKQLTGKGSMIYSGTSWYNTQYSNYGFSRGREPKAKALACYGNHVAVVEAVNGNTITISEGGRQDVGDANGHCAIWRTTRNVVESARNGAFLGYVYLSEAVEVGLSYSQLKVESFDTRNAKLYGRIENPGKIRLSQVGVYVWENPGTLVIDHRENCTLATSYIEQRLDIVKEAKVDGLKSGTNYTFQMYAIANGKTYYSGKGSFKTPVPTPMPTPVATPTPTVTPVPTPIASPKAEINDTEFILDSKSSLKITEDGILSGISSSSNTAYDLREQFSNAGNDIVFKDTNGNKIENDQKVGTGYTIVLMKDGKEIAKLVAAVSGDLNGDGEAGNKDVSILARMFLGKMTGTKAQSAAGDMNGDGAIGNKDIVMLARKILGKG